MNKRFAVRIFSSEMFDDFMKFSDVFFVLGVGGRFCGKLITFWACAVGKTLLYNTIYASEVRLYLNKDSRSLISSLQLAASMSRHNPSKPGPSGFWLGFGSFEVYIKIHQPNPTKKNTGGCCHTFCPKKKVPNPAPRLLHRKPGQIF